MSACEHAALELVEGEAVEVVGPSGASTHVASLSLSTSKSRVLHNLLVNSLLSFPTFFTLHKHKSEERSQTCRPFADISSSSVSLGLCVRARSCSTSSTSGKAPRAVSTNSVKLDLAPCLPP